MAKPAAPTGKPSANVEPLKPDEMIQKALNDIEEMKKAMDARNKALDEREKKLDARETTLKTVPTAEEEKKITQAYQTKAQKMKEYLWKQPLITIMIPLDQGEPEGTTFPITLNGYRLNIRKNTYVEVPKPVADILRDILKQNEASGREFRLDVPRAAKDGITIEEALM